jgi:hypothetical protein
VALTHRPRHFGRHGSYAGEELPFRVVQRPG